MAILQRGCCCTLRTCVCVLGWICVVLSVLALIGVVFFSAADCKDLYPAGTLRDGCYRAANAGWVQLVFTILWLIASILLLLGVKKENRFLLLPFMIAFAAMLLFTLINAILQAIEIGWKTQVIGYLVGAIIGICLSVYALLCVISHYQNLRDGIRVSGGGAPKV